jgi:AcrR family transcriptional regulator
VSREVVKRVGGRAYRYRVESYRDAESGRARARWIYLGKVDTADAAATVPPASTRRPEATRRRLIAALATLLEGRPYAEVTASAIAAEAGCAHGTFYRHFPDKRTALDGLLEDVRGRIERERPSFDGELGALAAERARVAAWVSSVIRVTVERPGLFRAWLSRCEQEPELARTRVELRGAAIQALAAHLTRLSLAGYCAVAAPEALARAIWVALDGVRFRVAYERADFADEDVAGVVTLVDRAIFLPA